MSDVYEGVADLIAARFHETYERLAPSNGYETRRESAVPWAAVPSANRRLMRTVVQELLDLRVIGVPFPREAEVVRLRASLTAVEQLCAEAEQRARASISRDYNGQPFSAGISPDKIRAAISGAAGGSGVTP